ncbi:MAG: nucleoside phosphorylase [Paramuribaculum sp.]|nr:nucleoside phosphorylase [Paramuribaculum sp.]
MERKVIESSELLINPDGSIFHLHLHPEQLADKIIMVGDPGRVPTVAEFFDTKDFDVQSREFRTIGGTVRGKRVMCISHGIGPDNMDIVVNELDALANIDLQTRTVKENHRTLTMVRIGTSGSLQPDIPVGTAVIAEKSIGFDGVLNYYAGCKDVNDAEFEDAFRKDTDWDDRWARPYIVASDGELVKKIGGEDMVKGITISAVGFYGPQGRELRLPLARRGLNESIERFEFKGRRITNYEMESAPLQGLSLLLGHKAMTVCSIIANRFNHNATPNYKTAMTDLIATVIERMF